MYALLTLALVLAPDLTPSSDALPPAPPDALKPPPEPLPPPAARPPETPAAENAQELPAARGSTLGAWSFIHAGIAVGSGTFVNASRNLLARFESGAVTGFGVEHSGVRFVPSVGFAWAASLVTGFATELSPVDIRVASPDLVWHRRTGLRLTPVLGVSAPTGWRGSTQRNAAVSLALQLERRFGPVELADRVEPSHDFGPAYGLLNRLLAEAWLLPQVSVALGFGLVTQWRESVTYRPDQGRTVDTTRTDLFDTLVQLNLAVLQQAGVSVSLASRVPTQDGAGNPVWFPFWVIGREAENLTTLAVSVWLSTDALIQRNWLDR